MSTPEAAGIVVGAAHGACGRAARFACDGGRTLWRLAASDAGVIARLAALGVGGVVAAGTDEVGPWLVRRAPAPTLADALVAEPVPWRRAVALVASLAGACAACERAAVYPGPIDPAHLVIDGDALVVPADALVAALCGEPAAAAPATAAARWQAPEELAGAPGDSAANRYVVGLVLYRLLAGEHPFAGAGLRRGLDEQAARGAPPFTDAIAAALPPGLQSLALRLLDPDPARRPASAAAIAAELHGLAGDQPMIGPRTGSVIGSGSAGIGGDGGIGSRIGSGSRSGSMIGGRVGSRIGSGSGSGSMIGPGTGSPIGTGSRTGSRSGGDGGDGGDGSRRGTSGPGIGSTAGISAGSGAMIDGVARGGAVENRSASLSRGGTVGAAIARRALPLAIALAGVIAAVTLAARRSAPASARLQAGAAHPLEAPRRLADCATCHPRHASEWSRSVMAHAGTSPLFQALEILIEEQVGRDRDCPGGAGILRTAGPGACRDRATGLAVTGSGGASWCVNCHTPGENLAASLPPWDGQSRDATTRRPLRDLLPAAALEGIGCAVCHQATGPAPIGAAERGGYEGNPAWFSPATGLRHPMRPEDARGRAGIANSGYHLEPGALLAAGDWLPGGAHRRPTDAARRYLASSEMCGACHDVRLFGTDAVHGESFKRLRNAYSEWLAWSEGELRAGRVPASCQDCHMSAFPAVCEPGPTAEGLAGRACPPGTRPRAVAPGTAGSHAPHYFTGVDVPLGADFDPAAIDDPTLDVGGVPVGARRRRDLLLAATFRFAVEPPTRTGNRLAIPVVVENVGAGHRVPAGFSQEREIWIHLRVTDARGALVYETGRVDRADEDLRDKIFLRVGTSASAIDRAGRPVGLFGADVADGPDVPRWTPVPGTGGAEQRGRGLVNFQNGFLRCVRCIGTIDADGACQPLPGQESRRADRYADGDYDADTGACTSNLRGEHRFLEVYFPVGALDATRGLVRGPDAIVDTRSLPPGEPRRSIFELEAVGPGPYTIEARLLFRAFPPYLLRAFADYEREQDRAGLRPSGPLLDVGVLGRLEIVEVATARAVIP